jgi:four helix bundle protein
MIRSFKDLEIYQEAFALVLEVYKLVSILPNEEKYDLGSQMRRAAVSVPANIAEGWAKRRFINEFKHYLDISLGSCKEMIVHLDICKALKYLQVKETDMIANRYDLLSGKIYSLQSKWKSYK